MYCDNPSSTTHFPAYVGIYTEGGNAFLIDRIKVCVGLWGDFYQIWWKDSCVEYGVNEGGATCLSLENESMVSE